MFVIFSVFYILVAAAMIVLILLQNGAGADAGSGFGSGASATVFGARGSATFLTRATGVLASLFFLLSIGMGIYLNGHGNARSSGAGLGIMAGATAPVATPKAATPSGSEVPTAAATGNKPAAVTTPDKVTSEVPAPAAPAPAKKH
jgi:protein translocase, SecG subunit